MAAVLALPERREQIVQITVRVAMCLDADARDFLADCQAGLIEGGLEYMRKRRHEMLTAAQQESLEAIVIVDSSEDQLLEQVGLALDALRLSEIVRQLFPDVRERHPSWEVARAFLAEEEEIRRILTEAMRAHGGGNSVLYEQCRKEMLRRIDAVRPPWIGTAGTLRALCSQVSPPGAEAERLLGAIAVDDMRARLVLDLMATNLSEAKEYLGEVKRRIDTLQELEARESK